jgi:hypothetical protein
MGSALNSGLAAPLTLVDGKYAATQGLRNWGQPGARPSCQRQSGTKGDGVDVTAPGL